MNKRMQLTLFLRGGGVIEREISYEGDSLTEIAHQIERDENDLLQYMLTHDSKGQKSFCFSGFIFQKASIVAAQMKEPEF